MFVYKLDTFAEEKLVKVEAIELGQVEGRRVDEEPVLGRVLLKGLLIGVLVVVVQNVRLVRLQCREDVFTGVSLA